MVRPDFCELVEKSLEEWLRGSIGLIDSENKKFYKKTGKFTVGVNSHIYSPNYLIQIELDNGNEIPTFYIYMTHKDFHEMLRGPFSYDKIFTFIDAKIKKRFELIPDNRAGRVLYG